MRTRHPARSASVTVPNVRVSMNFLVRLSLAQASTGSVMVAAFCSVPRITRGCKACRYNARTTATHMIRLLMTRQVTDPGPNKPSSSRPGSSGLVYVYGVWGIVFPAWVPPGLAPGKARAALEGLQVRIVEERALSEIRAFAARGRLQPAEDEPGALEQRGDLRELAVGHLAEPIGRRLVPGRGGQQRLDLLQGQARALRGVDH